jgi:hypothetical protein
MQHLLLEARELVRILAELDFHCGGAHSVMRTGRRAAQLLSFVTGVERPPPPQPALTVALPLARNQISIRRHTRAN